ncbi:hypothetical protein C1645_862723 [Glomus cerebriforme]|uniref:Uncharacterized protein n=1 Tax=Glomus cerebriforme TaxID=658196 RepID=A0A397SIL5_9GLOM|nr:hypothetical protein C1645_862723 [Glomus cerebriforme]
MHYVEKIRTPRNMYTERLLNHKYYAHINHTKKFVCIYGEVIKLNRISGRGNSPVDDNADVILMEPLELLEGDMASKLMGQKEKTSKTIDQAISPIEIVGTTPGNFQRNLPRFSKPTVEMDADGEERPDTSSKKQPNEDTGTNSSTPKKRAKKPVEEKIRLF